jgi:hypothetical protein
MSNEEQLEFAVQLLYELNLVVRKLTNQQPIVEFKDISQEKKEYVKSALLSCWTGEKRTHEEQHKLWMQNKLEAGWTYGEKEDAVAKTHPSILPYDQLSWTEKLKDMLFQAVAEASRLV